MSPDEAFEYWDVCYTQAQLARERLRNAAVWAVEAARAGDGPGFMDLAFERQDEEENAEAALSTARELWDAAQAAEDAQRAERAA